MRIRHSFSMKIHPSPSTPAPSPSPTTFSAVIKLLPPEIQSEVSGLPFEDLEVLAYLVKRSQKKSPSHDFEYYGSYWNRWNSSPNRNLISRAIDAYEESLDSGAGDDQRRKSSGKKKKDRKGKRGSGKRLDFDAPNAVAGDSPEIQEAGNDQDEVVLLPPPENEEVQDSGGTSTPQEEVVVTELAVVRGGAPPSAAADMNRGLARKVLPDVVGFFNSRLWNLWRPK